jgi:hypothetical protein
MKKLIIFCILILAPFLKINSQGYHLEFQYQIDGFAIDHPGITQTTYDLLIDDYVDSSITNLDGLYVLEHIGANLIIINNLALTSLSGLHNIISIDSNLVIQNNNSLSNLEGFTKLDTIGGSLIISQNNSLVNFIGLDSLKLIGVDVNISENNSLINFAGLGNFNEIFRDFIISDNNSLYSLEGVESLNIIHGDLHILNNASLMSLSGLNNLFSVEYFEITSASILNFEGLNSLSSIGESLRITELSSATNLLGLESLTSIGGALMIENNESLINLAGLDNLNSVAKKIRIKFNKSLKNLTGLNKITTINEIIHIDDNNALKNLEGLNNVTTITGDLSISNNPALTIIESLNKVTSISGNVYFYNNDSLRSLNGLNNLTSVGGNFTLLQCYFPNLNGLNNLNSIGGRLTIDEVWPLESFDALSNLNTIGGGLYISRNYSIDNLLGLNNLTAINGSLHIDANSLISLTGIDNIDPSTITGLEIAFNDWLSYCDIKSICEYLANPAGNVYVYANDAACYSAGTIISRCENHPCLPGGVTFSSQAEINDFLNNYPYCKIIDGDVIINGTDINDLSPLLSLKSIKGDLSIYNNDILTTLDGLNNIQTIEGDLRIGNDTRGGNPSLVSLAALENLTYLKGSLFIEQNTALPGLTGLENVQAGFLDGIYIKNNPILSDCDIQSICNYLASGSPSVDLSNNSTGCNTETEVKEACTFGVPDNNDLSLKINLSVSNDLININIPNLDEKSIKFQILDETGKVLSVIDLNNPITSVDISQLTPGLYFGYFKGVNIHCVKKIIKYW